MNQPPAPPPQTPRSSAIGVAKLLASALAAGVEVSVEGDTIRVKGPAGAKALAQLLVERKAEVVSAFGEWNDEAALALVCATDSEFENLGASGAFPNVQEAAAEVWIARDRCDMNAVIAKCRDVLKLARAQLATNKAA